MAEHAGNLMDAYLDGLLGAGERAAFELRLLTDARLQSEVERQRGIDAALVRLFAAPPERSLEAIVTNHRPSFRAPSRTSTLRRYAVAATLVLAVVGVYAVWQSLQPPTVVDPYAPQAWRSLETVYYDTVAGGFEPAWVCKDDREFRTAFHRRLGQPLLLLAPPPGNAWAGLDYCNSISPQTMFLLAWVKGEQILVFADQAARDKPQTVSPRSGLHLFRRVVGDLVLYECSPLAEAHVLDQFYIPDLVGP